MHVRDQQRGVLGRVSVGGWLVFFEGVCASIILFLPFCILPQDGLHQCRRVPTHTTNLREPCDALEVKAAPRQALTPPYLFAS